MKMVLTEGVFYRRWILANGWAEGAGLGTTFIIGRLSAPALERTSGVAAVLMGALMAILLGTLLEGIVVGVAQERVLRRRLADLPRGAWTKATAVGAALAWMMGMVPSTIMALSAPNVPESASTSELGALAQLGLASALGLVAGPILGGAQWMVLRRLVSGGGRWLWANALAWAVGMPLIFAGMDRVPWASPPAFWVPAIYAVCGATGLVVGAIHGRVLLYVLSELSFSRIPLSSSGSK